MTRIALLPPDERPNTRGYAVTIGRCAGVDIMTPPEQAMPAFRRPADTAALAGWLRDTAADVDHAVVSVELLVHGGLIPSRNTDDTMAEVLPRLDVLRELGIPVTAYGVVTRLPTYNNAARSRQEPDYWATHGERLGALSRLWDEAALSETDDDDVLAARAQVPDEYVRDLVKRRARNHVVNLAVLDMAADGVFDTLVISSDDTAPRGLPAAERRLLSQWIDRLGINVLSYPGADEVPSVLVARVAAQAAGLRPRIAVACADETELVRIAPYEDRPVRVGLANQIRAVGGVQVGEHTEADLVLAVHPPAATPGDWVSNPPDLATGGPVKPLVDAVERLLDAGHPVALADVHYANGGDPRLIEALDNRAALGRLTSYGGWNTAGNTIGTALAAGVTALVDRSPEAAAERQRFLVRKIIEDAHFLPTVRRRLQEDARARGLLDPPLEELPQVHQRITRELRAWASGVDALQGWELTDARLPWTYTFTVDFDLKRVT